MNKKKKEYFISIIHSHHDYIRILSDPRPNGLQGCIRFPETRAIARVRAGTHANKFTCAIYRTRKIIVFSLLVFVIIIYFP